MALHQSLLDLSELAPRCESPATARGLLEESQDLLCNALDHRESEVQLAAWFSRLVTDIVRSPAIASPVRLTGSVATGDATATSRICWLGEDARLEELLCSSGLDAGPAAEGIAERIDAGLPIGPAGEETLLEAALSQRPPALQLHHGLPDRNQPVDVHAHLLDPIQAIARWAAPAPRPALDRLALAQERQLLLPEETQSLSLAWGTGLALEMRAWRDHVDSTQLTFGDLPALDRTAYGSACRLVAEAFDSLHARRS